MCHHLLNAVICPLGMVSEGQKEDRISNGTSMAHYCYGIGISDFIFRHLSLDSDLDRYDG